MRRGIRIKRLTPFTLIELFVVVAFIAIMSGLALPILIKARDKARNPHAKRLAEQRAKAKEVADKPKTPLPGTPCRIRTFSMSTDIEPSYHRFGFEVFTRYRAKTKGTMSFNAVKPDDDVRVSIPLPADYLDLQDAVVTIRETDGKKILQTENLIFDEDALSWIGPVAADKAYVADFSFTVTGRESYQLPLHTSGRMSDMAITLNALGDYQLNLPESSLQPSSRDGQTLTWEFKSLVAKAPIVLEIPGQLSPTARVLLLCRLVAVAVLLFGAGFWYLSEIYKPGCLHDFRWSHFFLLALTFSLFFVVFGILSLTSSISVGAAMAVSAALSFPLLILHVSRVIDAKFAMFWIMPLTVYSLLNVINGVYGGANKWTAYIVSIVMLVGFLTVSWQRWMANHDTFIGRRIAHSVDARQRAKELVDSVLMPLATKLRTVETEGFRLINNHLLPQPLRQTYQPVIAGAKPVLDDFNRLFGQLQGEFEASESTVGQGEALLESAERIKARTTEMTERITACNQAASQTISEAEKAFVESLVADEKIHCCACGQHVPPAKHCQCCGKPLPKEITCRVCNHSIQVPQHLLSKKRSKGALHCPKCGALHWSAQSSTVVVQTEMPAEGEA